MIEYTYEDIIMDPEDPRLEGAIGKECYFSDYPKKLLDGARNNSSEYLDCLTNIIKGGCCPFVDKKGYGRTLIIIKKEEPKPQYVPFESKEEFIDAFHYHDNANYSETDDILLNYGMWLRFNNDDVICAVTEIWTDGVFIGHDHMKIKWEELFNFYNFLDGTPCGKEVEE